MIVWRGAGILVPIVLLISGWLTSYWFEDTRLGNPEYMAWTLLWSGIVVTIFGMGAWPLSKDPQTGKLRYIGNNDFLWIPMFVWGVGFLFFSIKSFNTEPNPVYDYSQYASDVKSNKNLDKSPTEVPFPMNEKGIAKGERIIKFYNPTNETIEILMFDEGGLYDEINGEVPALGVVYITVKEVTYILEFEGKTRKTVINASSTTENYDTDEMWFVLEDNTDLLLVDITETCYESLTKQDIVDIDWTKEIYERYDGQKSIEMNVKRNVPLYFDIRDPYYSLPITHTNLDQFFSIIPIPSDEEASDQFIEDFLLSICFKTEGVEVH